MLLVIGGVSLLASKLAVVCSQGFSFAWEAVKKAGDNPPKDVSFELEFQLATQAYLNALLTGVVLALLLALGFRGVRLLQKQSLNLGQCLLHLAAAAVIGGACVGLACLAFRLQPVGTQNLPLASVIHALLWGGLGFVVSNIWRKRPSDSDWKVPRPVLAGLLWGACFPPLVVLLFPGVYVEQLFSSDAAIALWAGVGCGLLLTASVLEIAGASTTKAGVQGEVSQC